jgi:NDP-sugar pyrophosphorylase family protein
VQIVIPMSGFGERFRRAGYDMPKPLIELEGHPIIKHVVDMFPGETDVLFICNVEHLDDPRYRMRETLQSICPSGRIVGIPPHKKGPVHAVLQVVGLIDMSAPVVVNYCDFTCYWNWADFRQFVAETRCAGAIPAYRGFHPHSLGTTNYAYMQETGGWLTDIREKEPFTSDRMSEFASSGTYYFSTGASMRDAFVETVARDLHVNGEHYVSLAYKPMLDAGARVAVYEIQHFMQWGTPEDVHEYRGWSGAFRRLIDPESNERPAHDGMVLTPMAGLGARFSADGYSTPKPLIPVSGRPMAVEATRDLPDAPRHAFVLRRDMPALRDVQDALADEYPRAAFTVLDAVTEGQACSALLGYADAACAPDQALTIGTCDNGAVYDADRFRRLMADQDTDVVVWVARGYPNAARQPQMYGWVACDGDRVTGVSVKKALGDPATDPIITGTFTFRRAGDFERCVNRMVARGARINGEYYIDTCIEDALALGLRCRIFEIEHYLCWGTPNDLRTFNYWQSCFHKWPGHPYRLELDGRVDAKAIPSLTQAYRPLQPLRPRPRA